MSAKWAVVSLGELLARSNETIVPEPSAEYAEITVRLWGKGVILRGMVSGAQIVGQRRYVARRGQFILSRIDARNGALGIVPPDLDGALVSNDFPIFRVAEDRLVPAYLGWLCKTYSFVEECKRASEGTTNRVRLQEDKFLARTIHLPPYSEQQRIAAEVDELASQINEARDLRQRARVEADAFIVSVHKQLSGDRIKKIGEMLELAEDATAILPTVSYPQVGVRSFGGGLFSKSAVEGTGTTYKNFNRLYPGALVLSQVKGWEGAVAVCPPQLEGWFVSPEYRTFRCIPTELRPDYLASLVRTEWFWSKLADATRGVGARRERTRPEQFLGIELPMPDVTRQRRGEQLFAEVSRLTHLQAETASELDAMLPAVISRAFGTDVLAPTTL